MLKKGLIPLIKTLVPPTINSIREKNTNKIHEAADVLYHLIVYLETNGIKIEDIMEELNKRKKQ